MNLDAALKHELVRLVCRLAGVIQTQKKNEKKLNSLSGGTKIDLILTRH